MTNSRSKFNPDKWQIRHVLMLIAMIVLFLLAAWIDGRCEETENEFENYFELRVMCHVKLGIYEEYVINVMEFDPQRRIIAAVFDHPVFTERTDANCQWFAEMAEFVTRDGWTLVIMNAIETIPCASSVIDHGLALKLLSF